MVIFHSYVSLPEATPSPSCSLLWIALEDLGGLHFQTRHPCGFNQSPQKKTHPPKNVWAHQGRILIANNHTQWLIEYLFLAVHRSGDEIKNDESDETRVSTCQGDQHILRPPSSQAKSMISWLLTQGRTRLTNCPCGVHHVPPIE